MRPRRGALLEREEYRACDGRARQHREPGVAVPDGPRRHLLETVAAVARRHRVRFAACHCSGHGVGAWGCFTGLPRPREVAPRSTPRQGELL